MPQTRANKIQVPINSDSFSNFTSDLATMADSANVVVKVASQSERDGLTKSNGLVVARTDVAQTPIERCDGTAWWGPAPHEEWTFTNPASTVPNNTAWGPGIGTLDTTANSIYTGFGSTPSNDTFQVNAPGRYLFHWYLVLNGTAGAPVYMSIRNAGGSVTFTSCQWPSAFEHNISVELNMQAGGQVKLVYVQTSGSTYGYSISHRLRVSKNG